MAKLGSRQEPAQDKSWRSGVEGGEILGTSGPTGQQLNGLS